MRDSFWTLGDGGRNLATMAIGRQVWSAERTVWDLYESPTAGMLWWYGVEAVHADSLIQAKQLLHNTGLSMVPGDLPRLVPGPENQPLRAAKLTGPGKPASADTVVAAHRSWWRRRA